MAPTVVDVSVEATSPPPTPTEENTPPHPPPSENAPKEKRRQRLLCRIQRMSSSPSLPQAGRSRSSSAPYGSRTNLSCVSLSPTPPFASASASSGSVTPGYFSSGRGSPSNTPGHEFSPIGGIGSPLAPRRTAGMSATALTPTTACLPADVTVLRSKPRTTPKNLYDFWTALPQEVRVQIFSYLEPKELVRVSRVNKEFHKFCFDGQLWTSFDASKFYNQIPAHSMANIIASAGPFIKDLNLRGCLQLEHYQRAEILVTACKNLVNASLEGCRNFQHSTLHDLIRSNNRLVNLNLTSMTAVTNSTCKVISRHCPRLETLNVSWCKQMDAKGVKMIILGCPNLKELRASEIKGFDSIEVAKTIFETNRLERLVLSGCAELTDDALKTMMHGLQPDIDILTDRPIVPPRNLRHLDLSRCSQLTDRGVKALGYLTPKLEGLQLNRCTELTDMALTPIIASTPRLTHLELEDLPEITNDLFSKHLANAPCASKLQHLSVSYCENLGNAGLIPVMKNCVSLCSVDMDNTRIGDLVLAEAATMIRARSVRTSARDQSPRVGLKLMVFDCNLITSAGIREVLSWNSVVKHASTSLPTYPSEIIGLKCYFGWQQTVDQHTQRVLRGDYAAAVRLERKWADYLQAVEEAGAVGAGFRRRRRRAREAQLLHAHEEGGGIGGFGRRRARTMAASCVIM
ncbi:RNI-like protein [Nemania abortiva]|nr:RNI-like protein [Nemania abortiva]